MTIYSHTSCSRRCARQDMGQWRHQSITFSWPTCTQREHVDSQETGWWMTRHDLFWSCKMTRSSQWHLLPGVGIRGKWSQLCQWEHVQECEMTWTKEVPRENAGISNLKKRWHHRLNNPGHKPRGLDTLWDIRIRRLSGYWNGSQRVMVWQRHS